MRFLACAVSAACLYCTGVVSAATLNTIANGVTRNVPANINGGGTYLSTINNRSDGGNHNVASFTNTYSLTIDGVTFEYDLTFSGGGGLLHNFNSPTFAYGIDNSGGSDNNALDEGPNPESLTFTVSNIVQTGGAPHTIIFDGFTELGIFFATSVSDAGAITDGSVALWSYDGPLGTNPATNNDPPGVKVTGSSTDDSLFTWFGLKAYTHAQVDVSGTLPQTMVYEVRSPTNTSDVNRVRLNNIGVQFTTIPATGLNFNTLNALVDDHFDLDQDYKLSGVIGSQWDGLMFAGSASILDANLSSLSQLTIETVNTSFDTGASFNAPFLYRNVHGHFDALLDITALAASAPHGTVGLLATAADNPGNEMVWVGQIEGGGFPMARASTVSGGINLCDEDLAGNYRYLRLTRSGTYFLARASTDGLSWTLVAVIQRVTLSSDLLVGITYGTFDTVDIGSVAVERCVIVGANGDYNNDQDVDSDDIVQFFGCYTGPELPVATQACGDAFDVDGDGDIDASDLSVVATFPSF